MVIHAPLIKIIPEIFYNHNKKKVKRERNPIGTFELPPAGKCSNAGGKFCHPHYIDQELKRSHG
jgi:hypothetical protein